MAPLAVDPDRKVKASTAVLVRMTDAQKAELRAYASRYGLSDGAACRQLMAIALQQGAST